MKNTFLFALALLLALGTTSCGREKKGVVELNFKALYDGSPLVMMEPYAYNDTLDAFFTAFNFYISDVALVREDGTEVPLTEIDFVDFDDMDALSKAQEGFSIDFSEVPSGKYKAVRIGIGVPMMLNETRASDYPAGHPLAKDSHYWDAWESYIFSMTSGKVDANGDGVFDDGAILYHCGSDEVYRSKELPFVFELDKNGKAVVPFKVDVHQCFKEGDGYIDLIAHPATHTIDNLTWAMKFMDNMIESFSIND